MSAPPQEKMLPYFSGIYADTRVLGMDWRAAFGLQVVGVVFFLWMFIMAFQVNRDEYD